MAAISLPIPKATWELHRSEILRLYVTEYQALNTVITKMQVLHGFSASVSSYKRQLSKWGIYKNITQAVISDILQANDASTDHSSHTDAGTAICEYRSRRLQQYLRRTGILERRRWLVPLRSTNVVVQPDPSIPLPQPWQTHVRFLHEVSTYIRGRYEGLTWHYPNYELLVESSTNQDAEKRALHNFINGVDTGRAMKRWGRFATAFQYWRHASRQIDLLVHGSYHDILPSVLLKLCELYDDGEGQLVRLFMSQIAEFSQNSKRSKSQEHEIYKYFQHIDGKELSDLYQKVMEEFISRFQTYFPQHAYNNHVMRNNLVRRRLKYIPRTTFDHELPDVGALQVKYGQYNRRPMDIIALRAECALERGLLRESEIAASCLIDHTSRIRNDEWLQLYYSFQGHYTRGCAMHRAQKLAAAEQDLEACLHVSEIFRQLYLGFMFDTQKLDALRRLALILTETGRHEEADKWVVMWTSMLQDMQDIDLNELSN